MKAKTKILQYHMARQCQICFWERPNRSLIFAEAEAEHIFSYSLSVTLFLSLTLFFVVAKWSLTISITLKLSFIVRSLYPCTGCFLFLYFLWTTHVLTGWYCFFITYMRCLGDYYFFIFLFITYACVNKWATISIKNIFYHLSF